jgi:hypothetical protein
MDTEMAVGSGNGEGKLVARPLSVLEGLIREDLQRGMEYYRAAGQKLIEARMHFVSNTEFMFWAEKAFPVKEDQIRVYMKYAEKQAVQEVKFQRDKSMGRASVRQPKQFTSLSQFEGRKDTRHASTWTEPVQEVVNRLNIPRLRQEAQAKEKEARLRHELGSKLIDIGYKVLATKLHPDKGGSREAMVRLNKVRDILKGAI